MKVTLTKNKFVKEPYYKTPIKAELNDNYIANLPALVQQFDQNGFDMTKLERLYAKKNLWKISKVRADHWVIKQDWFTSEPCTTGAHINHALLFERKGFAGEALEQLKTFAEKVNTIYKVSEMRSKWGLDFSIDYADAQGNVFEVLHWEWDSFEYDEIIEKKKYMDDFLLTIDWNEQAQRLLDCKSEWHHLGFFEQSEYKSNFFGIEKERFKMVIWK